MQPDQPTGGGRLWTKFLVGSLYLTFVAAFFALITDSNFLKIWLAVFLGVIFLGILALAWLTGWAQRNDGRLGQFGIPSLLYLTVFVAIFFSVVRWLAVNDRFTDEIGARDYVGAAIICACLFGFGASLMIGFMESLVWSTVWIVRRRPMRRWLLRRRKHQVSRFDEDA